MKRYTFFSFLFLCLVAFSACSQSNITVGSTVSTPAAASVPQTSSLSGTIISPTYVEDTEAQTCMNWHISINGAKAVDWCAAHMPGRKPNDYILLTSGKALNEYQIVAIQAAQQKVAVKFVQRWIPNGTEQHPFLLLVYKGLCSDVWGVTFEGVGMNPLCTDTMAAQRPGQYVELAGADQQGEFFVQFIDVATKAIVIG